MASGFYSLTLWCFQCQGPRQGQDERPAEVKKWRYDDDDNTDLEATDARATCVFCVNLLFCCVGLNVNWQAIEINKRITNTLRSCVFPSTMQDERPWYQKSRLINHFIVNVVQHIILHTCELD